MLPSGLDGVRAIVSMYADNEGAALLIVGHTDTSGAAEYNDQLSLERANALKDYLTQNPDGWLPWYGEATPGEKRWGDAEDEAMIGALPDAGTRDDGESPIRWYRRTRGMPPKDQPDKAMRQALIAEYMGLEGTSLPAGITVTTHGCGENFSADPTPDGVADPDKRRVEVFFFDGLLGVQPPPAGDNSGPGSSEYPEWVKRAKRTADHEHSLQTTISVALRDRGTELLTNAPYRMTAAGQSVVGRAATGIATIAVPGTPTRCLVEWGIDDDPDISATSATPRFQVELYVDYNRGSDEDQARKRLHNIGYPDSYPFAEALRAFQRDTALNDTGQLDDDTRAALIAAHGELATTVANQNADEQTNG